ncbi:hypothetical protein R3P38DRAFT_2806078 [Favolaschia claudopus]|uniref:Uncharacterized protein n=1 Tax=Favolaschia claudopus TaxID=2862362 RepID=A0AAV9ZLD9_9AGAR
MYTSRSLLTIHSRASSLLHTHYRGQDDGSILFTDSLDDAAQASTTRDEAVNEPRGIFNGLMHDLHASYLRKIQIPLPETLRQSRRHDPEEHGVARPRGPTRSGTTSGVLASRRGENGRGSGVEGSVAVAVPKLPSNAERYKNPFLLCAASAGIVLPRDASGM